MKKLITMICLLASFSTFAHMDHAPRPEDKVSDETARYYRGCFKEIEALGCGHPREDHEYFVNCYRSNVRMLSPACQSFFDTLYGQR
jgi:hypothetical protein